MRPPTPAMINALRHLAWRATIKRWTFGAMHCHPNTTKALVGRGWILLTTRWGWREWKLTPEGRRVLAEHPTTGDE